MAERNDNTGKPLSGAQGKGGTSTNMRADKSGKAQGLTEDRQQGTTKPSTASGTAGTGNRGTTPQGDRSRTADSDQDRRNAAMDSNADDAAEATTENDVQGRPGDAERTRAQREGDDKDVSSGKGRKGTSNDRGLH